MILLIAPPAALVAAFAAEALLNHWTQTFIPAAPA
jgi:hypothetical protein